MRVVTGTWDDAQLRFDTGFYSPLPLVSRRHFDSVLCVQELGGEGAVADPLPNPLISLKSDKPEDAPSSAKPPATAAGMGRQPFSHVASKP